MRAQDFLSARSLYKVQEGRLFVRTAGQVASDYASPARRPDSDYASAKIVLGVVALPKRADLERLHQARVNGSLWLDVDQSSKTEGNSYSLLDHNMSDLLTQIRHRRHLLNDSISLYVRETMLPHREDHLRWVFVAGVAPQALPAFSSDGLWEIKALGDGFDQVSRNTFNGDAMGSIFRHPIWGPGGRYGFATDMEPKTYAAWVEGNRKENMAREPLFAAYVDAIEAAMPMQLVYDEEFFARREALSKSVLRNLVKKDHPASVHAPSQASPRPKISC